MWRCSRSLHLAQSLYSEQGDTETVHKARCTASRNNYHTDREDALGAHKPTEALSL